VTPKSAAVFLARAPLNAKAGVSPGRDNVMRNTLDEKLVEPATIPPLEPRLENFDQDIRLFPAHRSVDLACRVAEDALA
jgi:hypothetical protein